MPKLSELNTPISGYNHIDSLLNTSPDWNYFQPSAPNTLFYTFTVSDESKIDSVSNLAAFTPQQRAAAVNAIAELAKYTGIHFVETADVAQAEFALVNANITTANVMGLAAWSYDYDTLPGGDFSHYVAGGTLYMDNVEFGTQNADLSPGTRGYETLLHELGHLLGLKHPFEVEEEANPATLPAGQDGAYYTVMSYTTFSQPGQTYAQYDIAALRWLYGGDGLGGDRGAQAGSGKYLMGTPFADTGAKALVGSAYSDLFEGGAGNDEIDGGAGTDFVQINVPRYLMTLARTAQGFSLDDGESLDQLVNIERVLYSGGAVALDIDGVGGQAFRVYNAVLGRAPDVAGLGFYISNMDRGVSLSAVAGDMMTSPEFIANFGANLSNQQLVQTLYQNILDRAPEQAGLDYWVNALNDGTISQPDALAFISESTENRSSVDPTIANGFMYTPWA